MKLSTMKRILATLVLGAGGYMLAASSVAQDFPSKPIRIIVPNAVGGATDVMARRMSSHMTESLGKPVVVENVTGGGGNIAATQVANSPADGYTIFFSTNILAANVSLYRKIQYDPVKSFSPIALLAKFYYVLVANPSFPAKDVGGLVKLLKDNPGRYAYASGGTGTAIHFTGALFKSVAGVDVEHVAYRGEAPAISDVIAGHVPYTFCTYSSAMPHIKAKTLNALAVSSPKRSPLLPDVPTVSETLPDYSMAPSWFSMVAPAGTPSDVIQKLNAAALKALHAPDVVGFVNSFGGEIAGTSPEEFAAFIKAEIPRWAHLVEISGAKAD